MNDKMKAVADVAGAAENATRVIEKLFDLPKKAKSAYREFLLDNLISNINQRLYGRYNLINVVETFGQYRDPQQDFEEIRNTARDRIKYLRAFNKKIETSLKSISPKLASELVIMTDASIGLYGKLVEVENPEQMAELAPPLADALNKIAAYLESVNGKLKEVIAEIQT